MVALILLPKNVGKFALSILHFMSLIDNDVLPVILIEFKPILQNEIVSSNANIPFGGPHNLQGVVSGVGVALVYNFTNGWGPLLELGHPVRNSRQRSDY